MRTRSQSRNNFPQQEASPAIVEPLRIENPFLEDQFQEDPPKDPPEVPMADDQTMAELLRAPTKGYEDAIVIPEIAANNFKLKHRFIELCCGWKLLRQNAPIMLEDNREQVQSSSITSQASRCQDKKNQSSAPVSSPTPAPVKAVEPNYVTCGGPTNSTPSKQGTEVTKDQVQTPSSQSTAPVQPSVIQPENETLISEPVVAPVSAPMPNLKSTIPYPSRHDNERRRDQANEQIEKFYEIFKDMSFEISFTDALIVMPKFASTLKSLIRNKEKLSEMARTPMNEHCSAIILNKLPRKLGDPDRSVSKPIGIAKDVSFKTDRALIDVHKGELTLRIENKAITYNLDQTEVLGFSDVTTSGNPTPYDDLIVSITSPTLTPFGDSDFLLFEEADTFLGLEDDPDSPKINPFYYDPEGNILFLEAILNTKTVKSSVDEPPEGINPKFCTHKILMEEDYKPAVQHQRRVNPKIHDVIKKEVEKLLDVGLIYPISNSPWVSPVHCVPKKGGFTIVENEENELIPTRLVTGWRVCIDYRKLNESTRKDHFPLPFMDHMLERLAGNKFYCFLDGFSGCMLAIFHDMVKKTIEVFMDDFSVFGNFFENCLSRLNKMLQRCEDTNLSLNWEKSHFMVKEGIVLGHKISKNRIEVDKAKVNVIAKLPHPTTVKGAVLGQRHEKHFKPIHYASKTMNDAESNYTTTEKEMLAVV
nr:DNA-directed DNA polymerase [Tanacetum cinerariifolium]